MRALTFADGDRFLDSIGKALEAAKQVDEAVAAYNTAARALRDAHKRGTSAAMIRTLYYPTLQRRYAAVQAATRLSSSTEVAMARTMQDIEYAVFGEVFTYTPDEARR